MDLSVRDHDGRSCALSAAEYAGGTSGRYGGLLRIILSAAADGDLGDHRALLRRESRHVSQTASGRRIRELALRSRSEHGGRVLPHGSNATVLVHVAVGGEHRRHVRLGILRHQQLGAEAARAERDPQVKNCTFNTKRREHSRRFSFNQGSIHEYFDRPLFDKFVKYDTVFSVA